MVGLSLIFAAQAVCQLPGSNQDLFSLMRKSKGAIVATEAAITPQNVNQSVGPFSFLSMAVTLGYPKTTVLKALKAGANVNGYGIHGDGCITPLVASIGRVQVGHPKDALSSTYLLLERGADPELGTWDDGKTCLMMAIEIGDVRLVETLLRNQARVGTENTDSFTRRGWNALHYAVFEAAQGKPHSVQCVQLLLEYGDVRLSRNAWGQTPSDLAMKLLASGNCDEALLERVLSLLHESWRVQSESFGPKEIG